MDVILRNKTHTRYFHFSNVCFVMRILSRVIGFQACQADDRCKIASSTLEIAREGVEYRSETNLKRRRGAVRARRVGNQIKLAAGRA